MAKYILTETKCDIEEENYGGRTAYQLSYDDTITSLLLENDADKVPLSDSEDDEDDDEDGEVSLSSLLCGNFSVVNVINCSMVFAGI